VRHHVLNECISRAFSAAGIPVKREPAGLVQSDGKCPDSCTLIPWCGGRPLVWDVTVCTMVAASYLTAGSRTVGAVAEQAADRKCSKYTELSSTHEFQPVSVESYEPLSNTTASFLEELGCKITDRSGEPLEAQFLYQSASVLVQCLSAIFFEKLFQVLLTPGILTTGGIKKIIIATSATNSKE